MIGQGVASLSPGLTFLRLLSKLSKPILAGQYWPLLQNCTTSNHYLLINCFPQKYELSLSSNKMFKQRRQKKTIKRLSVWVSLALRYNHPSILASVGYFKPCKLLLKWRKWSILQFSGKQKHHFLFHYKKNEGKKLHVTIKTTPCRL